MIGLEECKVGTRGSRNGIYRCIPACPLPALLALVPVRNGGSAVVPLRPGATG